MDETIALEALAALSNPTRLSAFRLLVSREPEGIAAGEVARLVASLDDLLLQSEMRRIGQMDGASSKASRS